MKLQLLNRLIPLIVGCLYTITEISYQKHLLISYMILQNVGWLDITMQYSIGMKVEDGYAQLGNNSGYILFWKLQSSTLFNDIFETLLASLHDNACIILCVFDYIFDFRNKRMIK
jgi:hypothetical protein